MTGSTKSTDARALFFGRAHCEATQQGLARLKDLGFDVTYVESKGRGETMPDSVATWEGDYIFCFRSLFILRDELIRRAKIAAINFHPAPVEYPGSGCLNFALYDGAKDYGVTAHIMNAKVDNGAVLECRRFPIASDDTVETLLHRTHHALLDQFLDVVGKIAARGRAYIDEALAGAAHEQWRGEAKKMSALEKLRTIPLDADAQEVERIIRATYTEKFPPRIFMHGYEFLLKSPHPADVKS